MRDATPMTERTREMVGSLRVAAADLVYRIVLCHGSSGEIMGAVKSISFDTRRLENALLANDLDEAVRGANSLVGVNKGIADTAAFWKMQDIRNAGSELSNLAIKVADVLTSERGGSL